MRKSIIVFFMVLMLMVSVNASWLLTDNFNDYDEEDYKYDQEWVSNVQESIYAWDVWNQYWDFNLSFDSALDLSGLSAYFGDSYTDLDDFTLKELETLKDLNIENNYQNPGDETQIDEFIKIRQTEINNTKQEFLQYASLKELQLTNINKIWVNIISFTQLVIEMVNILIYIISFYLLVFVVVSAIPISLIYMRDKILENTLKKRGFRK